MLQRSGRSLSVYRWSFSTLWLAARITRPGHERATGRIVTAGWAVAAGLLAAATWSVASGQSGAYLDPVSMRASPPTVIVRNPKQLAYGISGYDLDGDPTSRASYFIDRHPLWIESKGLLGLIPQDLLDFPMLTGESERSYSLGYGRYLVCVSKPDPAWLATTIPMSPISTVVTYYELRELLLSHQLAKGDYAAVIETDARFKALYGYTLELILALFGAAPMGGDAIQISGTVVSELVNSADLLHNLEFPVAAFLEHKGIDTLVKAAVSQLERQPNLQRIFAGVLFGDRRMTRKTLELIVRMIPMLPDLLDVTISFFDLATARQDGFYCVLKNDDASPNSGSEITDPRVFPRILRICDLATDSSQRRILITGTDLGSRGPGASVFFGRTTIGEGLLREWSSDHIEFMAGSARDASGKAYVIVNGKVSNIRRCAPAPKVSAITPPEALVGASVIIAGSGFCPLCGKRGVTFNDGVAASDGDWCDDQVTVNVPSGAVTGGVRVSVGGVTSDPVTFTVPQATTCMTMQDYVMALCRFTARTRDARWLDPVYQLAVPAPAELEGVLSQTGTNHAAFQACARYLMQGDFTRMLNLVPFVPALAMAIAWGSPIDCGEFEAASRRLASRPCCE